MPQRIKVLHLIDSLSVGGAERLLINLAHTIDTTRFEIHVCSLSVIYGNAFESDLASLEHAPFVIGARKFYDPRTFFAIARYIRKHNIDLIHTQLTYADITGLIVGRLTGRPVISTLQNEPQDYDRQRRDLRWLERVTTRYVATRLVGVSQRIRDMFIQQWGIPANKIETIYNAIPVDEFLAIPEGDAPRAAAGGLTITNIARLSTQKAQHILIQAAKIVLDRHPHTRFLIVGQGELEPQLKHLASELGVAHNVVFTGVRRDVPVVLAETDVFVLSSFWEGLPLTAIEAMAAARPVVLTDVGGNRELVQSGQQGLLVPANDIQALADALCAVVEDDAHRHAMGRAGRERVRHDFSITTITAQYEALYESLMRERQTQTQRTGIA